MGFNGLSRWAKLSWLADKWQALGFIDFGGGSNHTRLVGERAQSRLLSVGPGLRWNFSTYASLRADYGWQLLNEAEAARLYASRAHFGLVVRY